MERWKGGIQRKKLCRPLEQIEEAMVVITAIQSLTQSHNFPISVIKSRLYFYFFNLFFNVYLFLGQRETEHERGRGRERETQNWKQAPGSEPSAQSPTRGSNSRTVRS